MAHFLSYKVVVLVLNIVSCQCQMQVVARDEESCKFNFSQGQLVFNDDNRIISTPGQPATLQNGTKLHIKCLKGYSLEVMTDEGFLKGSDLSRGTSICQSGFWKPTYECSAGDPETCTTLANGSVKRMFLNEYEVSCNEGYALNLMRPDMPYCKCLEDKLVCKYGGQTPKCEPEPCKIPYSYDSRLTIFIRREGSVINLSGGVSVDVGETQFFNCINTDSENIEPNNRRFKCKNGKWLEDDENDKEWNLGYNGDFPSCRNTSCEPLCINGGKCIRDDRCQCPDLTSGTRCEEVLCDAECKKNGGTCIAPGTCGMCPTGKYGNNCEHSECNLTIDGPQARTTQTSYRIGDILSSSELVCPPGYIATPENGITCLEGGKWSETAKCSNSCKVPVVSNAVLKTKASTYYDHMEKVQYACIEGYHFHQDLLKQTNVLHKVANVSSTCEFGNWTNPIPEQCYPDGCRLSLMNGSHYYINESNTINEILENSLIPHGTNVSTECIVGYDMMKPDGSIAELNPQVTCSHGFWKNIHLCKKRCAAINDLRVINSSDDVIALDFKHGEKVRISCMDDIEITCEDGAWKDFDIIRCQMNEDKYSKVAVDYNVDPAEYTEEDENTDTTSVYGNEITIETTQNVIESSESLEGCEIPFDSIYEYTTTMDGEIKQGGSFVTHGTVLNVKCRQVDINDLLGEYYDSDHPTVQCINGQLGTTNISCLDKTASEENTFSCNLENGQVQSRSRMQYEEYYLEVFCNKGYKLNLIQPDKPYCKCMNTDLVCDYGGQTPECLPENCKIPEKYDSRLQIYVYSNGSTVSLSRGITVKHGNSVYFTCINSGTEHFEPEQTRFKCMNGKWLDEAMHEDWLKINSRFPKCRNAICLPPCENGGKCVKDNTCECQPQSTGRRCEKVECDLECHKNGGKCIAPGKCGQCPAGKLGNNCQDQNCTIPEKYDSGLTIYVPINGSDVSLSRGSEVKHGDSVYFKCTNNETEHFEPDYTRLECMKGKWLKVATHEEWLKLNSSYFPQCRKAICLPLCENGGKCVRENTCDCQPQSTGKRCETVECDPECQKNGGKCIAPGKCGKCPVGKLGNNCQDYGCLLPKDAPKIEVPKESYEIGEIINSDQFVCPANHLLMPRNGMICLHGGWTETAKCIANDQRETGDLFTSVICGLRPMELESRKKRGITERELASPNFQRILGGSTAPKGLHPWQVGVRKLILFGLLDMHLCGGTILSEYWILSVAHCFTDLPKSYVTVRVGDHNNNHPDDFEQEFELEHLIIHSQYNESTFDYDIALLKIKPKNSTGIKFGYIVQPACLPDQTSSYVDGQKCHVSGWGKTEYGLSGMLQSARVPIINDKTCRKLYNRTFTPRMTITPQMVCAGYLEGGADTCEGDSGGPLVCDINSRYTVMGATSWGNGCGKADAPGVYARVAAFVPWIKAKVKEYS